MDMFLLMWDFFRTGQRGPLLYTIDMFFLMGESWRQKTCLAIVNYAIRPWYYAVLHMELATTGSLKASSIQYLAG